MFLNCKFSLCNILAAGIEKVELIGPIGYPDVVHCAEEEN